MRTAYLITKTTNTLRICNIYCFPTALMITQCASCYVDRILSIFYTLPMSLSRGNYGPVAQMAETRDQFTVLAENWALQQTGSNVHNPKECVWNIDIRLCTPELRNLYLSIHLHL